MYQRLCILPIQETLEIIKHHRLDKKDLHAEIILFGQRVKISGMRLATFFTFGTNCERCGLVGTFFAVEKQKIKAEKIKTWHINLYGVTKTGEEVLITSDHIWPRALKGPDLNLTNRQTLCEKCNGKKRHSLPLPDECYRLLLNGMSKARLKELWRYGRLEIERIKHHEIWVGQQRAMAAAKKRQANQRPITL